MRCRVVLAAFVGLLLAASGSARAAVNRGTESAVALHVPARSGRIRVAILADRTGGVDAGLAVLEQAVAEINLLRPDLVLHIGDIVPGYTRDMDRWQADIARVRRILGRLEAPFFPLAGNHDVITGTGNPDDHRGEELHRENFGPLYYAFDYGPAHFVCLYTDEQLRSAPRLSDDQLDWLRADLQATSARHVFVLMHKPMWEYDGSGWDAVHELLRQHPVRAVVGGHFHHYYKSDLRDGIQYYVVGVTGGRVFSPELAGGLQHYCMLTVDSEGYRLALIKPGSVLPDDYIRMADFRAMERLRFLPPEAVAVLTPVQSPELGAVDARVSVRVTNPLEVALPVAVQGVEHGGRWAWQPGGARLVLEPHATTTVPLALRSPRVPVGQLAVPELEVQYTFTDSRGRAVPIQHRRRVPLRRRLRLPCSTDAIRPDGAATEPAWRAATPLRTARWTTSPYETNEGSPTVRLVATREGLCFLVEAPDATPASFRAPRMLSDAIFLGVAAEPAGLAPEALRTPPVVVIYPFDSTHPCRAVRAFWDARGPEGVPVDGVHAAVGPMEGGGWRCEGVVPWDVLTERPLPPEKPMRLNVGTWDNDGDLFHELHAWAPTADVTTWGSLVVGGD